jgi:hypothetical protein
MYQAIKQLINLFQVAPTVPAGMKVLYLPATVPNNGVYSNR